MCGGKGTFFRYEWTGGTDESCPSSAVKRLLGVKTASSPFSSSSSKQDSQVTLLPWLLALGSGILFL